MSDMREGEGRADQEGSTETVVIDCVDLRGLAAVFVWQVPPLEMSDVHRSRSLATPCNEEEASSAAVISRPFLGQPVPLLKGQVASQQHSNHCQIISDP